MPQFWKYIKALWNHEDGPTATEYAVLLGLIVVGVMIAMASFGDRVNNIYMAVDTAAQSV